MREVRSLLALELLILLRTTQDRLWTAADLTRELRATPEWTEQELAQLAERGLVEKRGDGFGFARGPSAAAAEFAVGWLAASYPAHRFSIIQALYAPGEDTAAQRQLPGAIQSFADAFKIRKEPPDG